MLKILLFTFLFFSIGYGNAQTANFIAPDTVCLGQDITINNISTGQTTNLWNFCKQAPTSTISGVNLGSSFMPIRPTFIDIQKDGNNYIGIIGSDNNGANFYRLNFGTNLLNTPTFTNLGTFGGVLVQTDGVKIIKENNNWYCFVAANNNSSGYELARLDFGNSLLNTPTLTNFGNLSGVINDFQTDLDILKTSQGYIGFIGLNNGSLLRLNFGNNITNTPTAINLGYLGGQTRISAFGLIYRNNNYYLFMPNDDYLGGNYFINRLNFGNSLLNTPTSSNLGNPNNLLERAYDFLPFIDCDNFKGYVLSPGNNTIIEYTFPNDVSSGSITGINKGNIGQLDFPGSFSNVVLFNKEKYVFITNTHNNTITRLKLSTDCNTFGVPSSTATNPPIFHIDNIGTYNISLTLDENLGTETRICKEIVVIDSIQKPEAQINSISCSTDSIRLSVSNIDLANTYSWTGPNSFSSNQPNVAIKYENVNQAGQYILTANSKCGSKKDTVSFVTPSNTAVNLGNDTSICQGASILLDATTIGTNVSYIWSTGETSATILVNQSGTYKVTVSVDGCSSQDSININLLQAPAVFSIGNDTTFCGDFTRILSTGNVNTSWNTGETTSQISINQAGTYIATISNVCGVKSDTIVIQKSLAPIVEIKKDTTICDGESLMLEAISNASNFVWSTGETSGTITINQAGKYWVIASKNNCIAVDTVYIEECEGDLWIPNAFSPNQDNMNDYFQVFGRNLLSYTIKIYNRWGEEVFESDKLNYSWDGMFKGEKAQQDTYVWLIKYSIKSNGKIENKMKKGTLTLLR